jgi:hypothetical protein
MGRKVVTGVAYGADPDLGREIHLREGVENGEAGWFATERGVGEGDEGRREAERGDARCERDNAFARLNLGSRQGVPCQADRVGSIRIGGAGERCGIGRHRRT